MAIDPTIALNVRPVQVDDPLQMAGKALSIRGMQQQQQMGQQEIQQRDMALQQQQMDLQDQQKFRQAWQAANGDPDKAFALAAQNGVGPRTMMPIQQTLLKMKADRAKLDNDQLDIQSKKNDQLHALLDPVAKETDPVKQQALWQQKQGEALQKGLITLEEAAAHPYPGPDNVKGYLDSLNTDKWITSQAAQSRAQSAATQAQNSTTELNAKLPGLNAESEIKAASANALKQMTRGDWQNALDTTVPDKASPLYQRTQAALNLSLSRGDLKGAQDAIKQAGEQLGSTERAVATAKATAPIKVSIATQTQQAQAMANATEDDYRRAGEQYALTGVMPPLGLGSASRAKVNHYAQEWARENGYNPRDLAVMQAAYQGDKNSLANFQKQRDQISSFEKTAGKNLDLFLTQAQKIVDSGSPWINTPLRRVARGGLGNADLAAYEAARRVATNEIAKVTQGGGLSGVLSDTARKEVEDFNPQNATLAQTVAVAKVLREDMANRIQSMDAALGEIKGRIGNPQAQVPSVNNGGLPKPTTKADRDRLPVGAHYIGPDGHEYVRQ